MEAFQISLPISRELHSHNKGHWRTKVGVVRSARELAMLEAIQHGRRLKGKVGVFYRFKVPDNRRRDEANLIQSCKPYIDGVVDSGKIQGDHWQALGTQGVSVEIVPGLFEVELLFQELSK